MTDEPTRVPAALGSTYRLQLQGRGFAGATALVPYLDSLGIETLYCSPLLRAVPGSSHGYDVVDPTRLDPALGTPDDYEALLAELAAHGMRLLIDIVPNHMSTDRENAWWWDVLRQGRQSPYADSFDIDWTTHEGRVLVPTLATTLRESVRDGDVAVVDADGDRELHLDGQRFPLAPGSADAAGPLSEASALDVLARQHYELSSWRTAGDQVNYRRFFDIDGLVGVRVEDAEVWRAATGEVLRLVADDRVAGLRIDHIDGLARPGAYLESLRRESGSGRRTEPALVVEKILGEDETMPTWPVDGTTGYEFADVAGALFIDAVEGLEPFEDLAVQAKRAVLARSFGAAADRLVRLATTATMETLPPERALTPSALHQAVVELAVHLDVYRTYFDGTNEAQDRRRVLAAAAAAANGLRGEPRRALEVLVDAVSGGQRRWREFVVRWQQLTSAVTAKGVEDTAGYRVDGPLGHAEVGSRPDRPPLRTEDFAAAMRRRLVETPLALNTTSTHDTKRSEDVRARLYALSEWWPEWSVQVEHWDVDLAEWVAAHGGPEARMLHFVYQTLVALWPTDVAELAVGTCERVAAYLVKAAREAKVHTTWAEPDERYEASLVDVTWFLGCDPGFGAAARAWSARLAPAASTTSLALTVLKVVCPGVPDVYQGNELVQYALTDPDNRRAVDFDHRRALLDSLDSSPDPDDQERFDELLECFPDGRLKLHVLRRALQLRRRQPDLFTRGEVDVPEVRGAAAAHVVALGRRLGTRRVLVVVPRLTRHLVGEGRYARGKDAWDDTELVIGSGATFVDVLTGNRHECGSTLRVSDVTERLPVALLLEDG